MHGNQAMLQSTYLDATTQPLQLMQTEQRHPVPELRAVEFNDVALQMLSSESINSPQDLTLQRLGHAQ
jgi:hypothetical protein